MLDIKIINMVHLNGMINHKSIRNQYLRFILANIKPKVKIIIMLRIFYIFIPNCSQKNSELLEFFNFYYILIIYYNL
jgi:hypothetical protein